MASSHWPLFDLEVRTPLLTLRYPDDDLLVEMLDVAAAGIHDDDFMPFSVPWTRLEAPQLHSEALRFHWRSRAEARRDSFRLPLAVIVDGEVVGASDLMADEFPVLRQVTTGSWLGRPFQGRGLGKEMRLATLTLGFDGFGAEVATTGFWHDNGPSQGVTRSLGYRYQGTRRAVREGVATDLVGYEMDSTHFATLRRDDITLHGVEPALDLLGLLDLVR
ncbi:MAG: GNAT family protein [Ilumatobacter sp.]|uniref:GNAT family N-acetyltransferase n=1 Tax=Ilumatobacter sp. TaxID=1967498 RepID=UPI0032999F01